jgi:hypothetical protein
MCLNVAGAPPASGTRKKSHAQSSRWPQISLVPPKGMVAKPLR